MDLFFLMDIIVNSHTAYVTPTAVEVCRHSLTNDLLC